MGDGEEADHQGETGTGILVLPLDHRQGTSVGRFAIHQGRPRTMVTEEGS